LSYAESPRVVFDCNVYVQAIANENSPAARALDLLDAWAITLYVSEAVLHELRDVLSRQTLRRILPGITERRVRALFQRLERHAVYIHNVPEEFRYERDPKDERYVNLALVAHARYLVSRDQDLLDLVNPSLPASASFRNRYSMLRIMTVTDFIKEMDALTETEN
jgi:putative PIN family toxin of toxin-antitoxin system